MEENIDMIFDLNKVLRFVLIEDKNEDLYTKAKRFTQITLQLVASPKL